MYTKHFGLQNKPFDSAPDLRFLWLSDKHRRKLDHLKHAALEQNGFLVITGDIGTGKTAMARCLVKRVEGSASVITVPDPDMEKIDFFNYLADDLRMNQHFNSKTDFLIRFKHLLCAFRSRCQKIILVIDEAHRLSHEMLQEMRLLLNIDLGERIQLSIVLIGQPELEETLQEKSNGNVLQRIAASLHLEPLTMDEMRAYIAHRLRVAGSARWIFTPLALKRIYFHTFGYPRAVNAICDSALMSGYAAGIEVIGPEIIDECGHELKIAFDPTAPEPEIEAPIPKPVEISQNVDENRPEISAGALPSLRMRSTKIWGYVFAAVLLAAVSGYALRDQITLLLSDKTQNEIAMQSFVEILEADRNNADETPATQILIGHELGEDPAAAEVREESKPGPEDRLEGPAPRIIRKKIEFSTAIDTDIDPKIAVLENNQDVLSAELAARPEQRLP